MMQNWVATIRRIDGFFRFESIYNGQILVVHDARSADALMEHYPHQWHVEDRGFGSRLYAWAIR